MALFTTLVSHFDSFAPSDCWQILIIFVEYFDQHMGTGHSNCWSKCLLSVFFAHFCKKYSPILPHFCQFLLKEKEMSTSVWSASIQAVVKIYNFPSLACLFDYFLSLCLFVFNSFLFFFFFFFSLSLSLSLSLSFCLMLVYSFVSFFLSLSSLCLAPFMWRVIFGK